MQRRKWHLTQDELAFLLGYLDQPIIARLERGERAITIAAAHACELIFGVEPRELFPALFEGVEARLLARLKELQHRLIEAGSTEKTLHKRDLLRQAIERLAAVQEHEV